MYEADKDLLIRYFHGTCNPAEERRAQELLNDPQAGDFFKSLAHQEWEAPVQEDDSSKALHARWKENVHARILSMERNTPEKSSPVKWLTQYRYAAIWIGIFFSAGILIWQWKKNGLSTKVALIEQFNRQGIPARYILPDSSEVFLAAGSKISYPERLAGNTREISLKGEAFFQVTHHPEKPFIIHTGDIDTKVLGTSFKVTAVEGRPLEVAVATGKVGVSRQETLLANLTSGYKISWDAKEQKATTAEVSIDGLEQWKNGDLVFDRLDMVSIAGELQRRYDVTILFVDPEVSGNRVSGTFAASKTASQVIKTLAMAGKFRYDTPDNKTFHIYKEN